MAKHWTSIGVCMIVLTTLIPAVAEKSTEQYIPIGRSPGLSGKHTLIARIVQVSASDQTLTVHAAGATYTVSVTQATRIFLDKSRAGAASTQATLADCAVGDTLEVKFVDNSRSKPAEWIKVERAP